MCKNDVMPSAALPTVKTRRTPALRSHETKRGLILLFVGLVLAMLLASLSQTVLSAAMPTMVGELNGVDLMLWVMTAYILASTIMMPIYGKVGDRLQPIEVRRIELHLQIAVILPQSPLHAMHGVHKPSTASRHFGQQRIIKRIHDRS